MNKKERKNIYRADIYPKQKIYGKEIEIKRKKNIQQRRPKTRYIQKRNRNGNKKGGIQQR